MTSPTYADADAPELLWPEQWRRAAQRCSHCGSGMLEVEVPDSISRVGEIRCLLCARTIWRLRSVLSPTLREPARRPRPVGGRQRCLSCGSTWVAVGIDDCYRCAAGPRPVDGQVAQLLSILDDGELHPGPALCAALGVTYDRFRAIVKVCQRRRIRVVAEYGRGYRLEEPL